ncbi:MAG: GNAT family N-acetyltransferase [Microgenomates group bacterium]
MIYPFQTQEYRNLFKKHFITDPESCVQFENIEYELLPDNRAVLVGMKPVLGGQEVTDFGIESINNEGSIHAALKKKYAVQTVQYDYIREDSLAFQTLQLIAQNSPTQQEVSPTIILPSTWEEYLESLERTDRKELKRKFKRLEAIPHSFHYSGERVTDNDFSDFIRLHKLSDFAKEKFMTDPMKSFFKEVSTLSIPGWTQKIATLKINDISVASVFFFENENSLLLYNSGYDPEQKYYSVGLLLIAQLIHYAIENKRKVFDFLRGNERYKYDLGGKDVKLYKFVFEL